MWVPALIDQDVTAHNHSPIPRTEIIETTAEHPFWVEHQGWTPASALQPGDVLFTAHGGFVRVSSGTWLSKPQTVYNIEVEDWHTYFVGDEGVWVHNDCLKLDPRSLFNSQPPRNTSFSKVDRFKKEMKQSGYDNFPPIEVAEIDGRFIIQNGHHRQRAAILAGLDKIPVNVVKPRKNLLSDSAAAEAAWSEYFSLKGRKWRQ